MTNEHPITPPPELVQQLANAAGYIITPDWFSDALEKAFQFGAQWGADQELEACCKWQKLHLLAGINLSKQLRAARRPKPPSLKEQALEDLEQIDGYAVDQLSAYEIHGDLKRRVSNIRRALEALPDE